MHKRIIGLLSAIALIVGLGAVAATPVQASVPKPLVGYNSNTFSCYKAGVGYMYTTMTWNVVDLGPYLTNGRQYSIQVKKIVYNGPTLPSSGIWGVRAQVGFMTNGGYLNLKVGGGGQNAGMMPVPVVDGASQTDGVGGVTFPALSMYWQGGDTVGRRLLINFFPAGGGYCQPPLFDTAVRGHVDSLPDAGSVSTILHCESMTGPLQNTPTGETNDLNLTYTITPISVSTYAFKITNATYVGTHGPVGGIGLTVNASTATPHWPNAGIESGTSVHSGTSNWTGPSGGLFVEADGSGGVSFPTTTLTDAIGGQYPWVLTAYFRHSELGTWDNDQGLTSGCIAQWNLTTVWQATEIPTDPAFATVLYDDCTGSAGTITVTPKWEQDANGKLLRVKSLSIYQSGDAKLVFDAGTSATRGGITALEGAGGGTDRTTISSGMSLADRTVTSGETQIVDVDNPTKWVRRDGTSPISDPKSIQSTVASNPYFTLTAHVILPNGQECSPSSTPPYIGGIGHATNLEFAPYLP